jgi:hypothetical protein
MLAARIFRRGKASVHDSALDGPQGNIAVTLCDLALSQISF